MRSVRPLAVGTVALLLASATAVALSTIASAAVQPLPNPLMQDSCGTDVTLVLDASGSINSSNAVDDVRTAAEEFLDALKDTKSSARVTQFATVSQQLAPRTVVDEASLAPGGALRRAYENYYNPKPPIPSNVQAYEYKGTGNPLSSSSYRSTSASSANQYTNWDQSLDQAGTESTRPELVVFVTDGDPTAFDFSEPSDPFDQGPPPDVAIRTDETSASRELTLDRAVTEANQLKVGAGGSRVLAVGVGAAVTSGSSVARLVQVSGPQVVRDSQLGDIDSINDIDVALVERFDVLASFLRGVVAELCSPSLTVRKLGQTASDASFQPISGWDITTETTVDPGSYEWILPDTDPTEADRCDLTAATVRTCPTDDEGYAAFQWEPDPSTAVSSATVTEEVRPGYTSGRPGADNDYRCELKNEDGSVDVIEADFDDPENPSFEIDPVDSKQIITCSIFNSFDYDAQIAITKADLPVDVRGDLDPPAEVVSTFEVTNPGNTPLANVGVSDDQCAPAEYQSGDTNDDGFLAPAGAETWVFTCTRQITAGLTFPPTSIENTATAQGADPRGETVTSDPAVDDVTVYVPAVTVDKTVDADTVVAGDEVTYSYEVSNTGNTDLSPIVLADASVPATGCGAPSVVDDSDGDAVLSVGEVWTYECTATIDSSTVNVATVTGLPIVPSTGEEFAGSNPEVTDRDFATVDVLDADLALTKVADPTVTFPWRTGDPDNVTYTYTATNNGTASLRNATGAAGWVTDDKCSPVTQVLLGGFNVGDVNQNDLMDADESWQFTCSAQIQEPTTNTATIIAQPVVGGTDVGAPLERTAVAFVDVREPGIAVVKEALRGVVLDPGADPISGPDFPTPREAEYSYGVTNTGAVPLQDVNPTDPLCAPLVFESGDTANLGELDPTETWTYTCSTTLDRDDANTPADPGDESGLVTNTVTVSGVPVLDGDPDPSRTVTDTDTAQVLVIEPGINLIKSVSSTLVRPGTDVSYTYEVSNTGDVGLVVSPPTDDKCAPLVLDPDSDGGNGLLDGANSGEPETWTYTCTTSIGGPDPVTNTATVQGMDPLGNTYESSDAATVRVFDPGIGLTKTVSDELVLKGTDVTYQFAVTNEGESALPADDVLERIRIADVSTPDNGCVPSYTGGDPNGDNELQRGETWTYSCSAPVLAPTTNVAEVTGDAIDGEPVVAFDAAFTRPFSPGIDVVKTASPTVLLNGPGDVTYTYKVRNTGDVPLANVSERIEDDTCSPVTYRSGDLDGDELLDTPRSVFEDGGDETWVYTCTTRVSEDTTNTVVVEGTPTDPNGQPLCASTAPEVRALNRLSTCDVDASDQATVTVVDAGGNGGGGGGGDDDGSGGVGGDGSPLAPTGIHLLDMLLVVAVLLGIGARLRAVRRLPRAAVSTAGC